MTATDVLRSELKNVQHGTMAQQALILELKMALSQVQIENTLLKGEVKQLQDLVNTMIGDLERIVQ